MALKNNFFINLIIILLLIHKAYPAIILPELLTKQAVTNIRFISQDGKFTYYQKRSGSLLFSTNYKVQEIMKGAIGTEYTLIASPAHKKIIILQNPNFHNLYSFRRKLKIFLLNFGETTPIEIGRGISPRLLLDDTWLSYYDPYSKNLNFESTKNAALKFSIKLNNKINPYFIPNVLMSDENTIYYTDLNEKGMVGVLEYKRNSIKSSIIYKASSTMVKAEICINQNHLILGLFGIHFSKEGSSITSSTLPFQDFSKRESIYTSELNDIGHLICDFDKDNIAFIKNYGNVNSPAYDIANLNTLSKKLSPLTELKTITNILNLDGTLLTQEKGKYYVVKGDVDYKNVDALKSRTDNKVMKKNDIETPDSEKTLNTDEENIENE